MTKEQILKKICKLEHLKLTYACRHISNTSDFHYTMFEFEENTFNTQLKIEKLREQLYSLNK
jgi:hypothetical protein